MNAEENAKVVSYNKTIMMKSFNEVYEEAITNTFYVSAEYPSKEDADRLAKKRKIGLVKYGDSSFQSSFDNALSCPTIDHAVDELLDCMNYLLHEIVIKANFLYPSEIEGLKKCFTAVYSVYLHLKKMKRVP